MSTPRTPPPEAAGLPGGAVLLGSVIDAIPQAIAVFDADRRLVMANAGYARLFPAAPVMAGERLEDIIRRHAHAGEFGPGEPERLVAEQMHFDLGRPQARHWRRPNGTMIDIRTVPLADGGHVRVVTDVTPLTEAERTLARRAAEMDVMLESIRHGILLWGPDRRLLAANRSAREILRRTPGILAPGLPLADLLDALLAEGAFGQAPEGAEMVREMKLRTWDSPRVRRIRTPAGRYIEACSDPTPDGGLVTSLSDLTDMRDTEEALRAAKEAAEAASSAKSRFLATMSHELRTPLNVVIGFSEALQRDPAGVTPRIAEFAAAINEAGRHLLDLIDVILDVARIDAGGPELAEETVDVAELIHACLGHARPAAQRGNLSLLAAHSDALPRLRADRHRLAQVLGQLLSNAVKFTGPSGTITVGVRLEEEGLVIFVTDTGIGIAEADLDRVFEPFTQIDSGLARRFPGTGLGLYLARALVEQHGGRLELKSRLGAGTSAEVRLPGQRLLAAGSAGTPG